MQDRSTHGCTSLMVYMVSPLVPRRRQMQGAVQANALDMERLFVDTVMSFLKERCQVFARRPIPAFNDLHGRLSQL
jgi:hypothetical protein